MEDGFGCSMLLAVYLYLQESSQRGLLYYVRFGVDGSQFGDDQFEASVYGELSVASRAVDKTR